MNGLQEGVVKFFLSGPDTNYGFIILEGGKTDIFFHKGFGGEYYTEDGVLRHRRWEEGEPGFVPASGDHIMYKAEEGARGYRATEWGSVISYTNAVKDLEQFPCYRLLKRVGARAPHPRLHRDATYRVEQVWEGRNIEDLESKFPMARYPARSEKGYYLYFQIKNNKGEFVDIEDDPREEWLKFYAEQADAAEAEAEAAEVEAALASI